MTEQRSTRKRSASSAARKRSGSSTQDMAARRKRRHQKQRRRLMTLAISAAVALIAIIVVIFMAISALFNGSDEDANSAATYVEPPTVNTLTINADGTVVCEEVSTYNEADYEAEEEEETTKSKKKKDAEEEEEPSPLEIFIEEIQSFVDEQISAYNSENGSGSIILDYLQVANGTIYIKITYASVADYAAYTGYTLEQGTPAELSNDYDFSDIYVEVADGEKGDSVDGIDLMSESEVTLLLIKENIRVVVPGGIVYITDYATELADTNVVDISQPDGNNDATTLTYIFYDTSIEVATAVAEDDTEETEEE